MSNSQRAAHAERVRTNGGSRASGGTGANGHGEAMTRQDLAMAFTPPEQRLSSPEHEPTPLPAVSLTPEAVAGLSDEDLAAHRERMQERLADPGLSRAGRDDTRGDLAALEWADFERHGEPPVAFFEPPPAEQAPTEPAEMRRMLEQLIASRGEAEAARYVRGLWKSHNVNLLAETAAQSGRRPAPAPELSERSRTAARVGSEQLQLLQHEHRAFVHDFEKLAERRMESTLGGSEAVIKAELARLGVVWNAGFEAFVAQIADRETSAVYRLGKLSPDSPDVTGVMRIATTVHAAASAGDRTEGAAQAASERADLAASVRYLHALQEHLDGLHAARANLLMTAVGDDPGALGKILGAVGSDVGRALATVGGPGLAMMARLRGSATAELYQHGPEGLDLPLEILAIDRALAGSIEQATRVYQAAWIEQEREHPVLAAFRDGQGDRQTLANIAEGGGGQVVLPVVQASVEKLINIRKAQKGLREGKYSIWALPRMVDLTRREMLVVPGSARDRLVADEIRQAGETDWRDVAIIATTVALVALTAIPTRGRSIAVGAEVAGLVLDAYLAYGEIEQYEYGKAAANTDYDRARAISDREPSLTWLAVELVGIGLGMKGALDLFDQAVQLRRMIQQSGAAAVDLPEARILRDRLNAAHSSSGYGDRVIADARRGAGGPDADRGARAVGRVDLPDAAAGATTPGRAREFRGLVENRLTAGGESAAELEAGVRLTIERVRAVDPDLARTLEGIPMEELMAIRGYTTQDYIALNSSLRGYTPRDAAGVDLRRLVDPDLRIEPKELAERLAPYVALAESGLSKLPPHPGRVYRSMHIDRASRPDLYARYTAKDTIVEDAAFLSTSTKPDLTMSADDNFKLVISQESGREVSYLSKHQREQEVLFPPHTRFRVVDVETTVGPDGKQQITVYMKEVR